MKYRVNIKKTEEGYAVWVPGLPGCWSQGVSEDEALDNIKDAIKDYLHTVDTLTSDKETRYVEIANA
ncbi:MAG: type II toxin-antitoxin system HicB family antitoxin [Deltaproteobacteria bacterium]|nr:type II toxin-antitoxin system HicB family antitoxin [Deltaproteobacteria bacterium]